MRERIGLQNFKAWFVNGEAGIVEQTDDTIRLAVKSKFFAQYIANQYEAAIARCAGVERVEVAVPKAGPAGHPPRRTKP